MGSVINIVWLYPDILNIHGGRGDLMAFRRVGEMMELPVEIRRCESYTEEIPFEWADIIYMTSGEIKCMPEIVHAIGRQEDRLNRFIDKGGALWAISSSGAALGKGLEMMDGGYHEGLGILDMAWRERESVWGDDLWFSTDDGIQVIGNQIQVADIFLNEGQEPFGNVIYGRGNCGDGREGAKRGNVVFTNCLGPMMVKNPGIAASLLSNAAMNKGIEGFKQLSDEDIKMEDESFELIKKFVEKKMNK